MESSPILFLELLRLQATTGPKAVEEFQDKIGRDSGALRCTHGKVSCLGFPVMGDLRSQVFSLSGFSPGRGSQGPRFHRNARRNPERRPMTGKWVTTLVPEPAAGSLARKPPGQRPTEEVDRCVPQELSLDCCLENERVLGHTGRLLVDIHLLCWGLLGFSPGPRDPGSGSRCGGQISGKRLTATSLEPGEPPALTSMREQD